MILLHHSLSIVGYGENKTQLQAIARQANDFFKCTANTLGNQYPAPVEAASRSAEVRKYALFLPACNLHIMINVTPKFLSLV